jgi:hypothetical protein
MAMTKKLTPRRVYDGAPSRNHFGWDLRQAEDWRRIEWKRTPFLSDLEIENWPYRFESAQDMKPDFSITVEGDPSDDLLASWVEEEEKGEPLTCLAATAAE